MGTIQIKRGLKANLPSEAVIGGAFLRRQSHY